MHDRNTCPKCRAQLAHTMVRTLKSKRVERVHVDGGAFVERVATEELVAECSRCGIIRKTLFGVPQPAAS